ncbi:Glycerol-3-phosphate dehydrogenase [Colletotrichum sp. SAR 10_98]|nr:Glycerol-3-phosphate dehydrogenase [Colletotrichum sp. SAR 10_98]
MRRYASKAQQVVLAAAVFDRHNRILVNPDGLVPTEKITDTFLEKNASDNFSISHPLFLWMFQASRNWSGISTLVGGMMNHLAHLPRRGRDRDSRAGIQLINEHGELIENYDVIFRELFCVAAAGLAEKMKEHITSAGLLWDEILPTGAGGERPGLEADPSQEPDMILNPDGTARKVEASGRAEDLAEKGLSRRRPHEFGRGSLMFLVRRVHTDREIERLEAAGYRFAELRQVGNIIGSSMQIKSQDLESKLRNMAAYADDNSQLEPGVHVGFFGIRARVGGYGFDVLVRKGARNLLPSVHMPIDRIEPWQVDLLRQVDRLTPLGVSRRLASLSSLGAREILFAQQLTDSIDAFRTWMNDSIFNEAILTSTVVNLPGNKVEGSPSQPTSLVTFRLVIPIHVNVSSSKCEFVPLNFFKVHQLVGRDASRHLAFTQSVHREMAPVIQSVPLEKPRPTVQSKRQSRLPSALRRLGRLGQSYPVDSDGNPIPTVLNRSSSATNSHGSSSTLKLWPGRRSSDALSPGGGSFDAPPAYPTHEAAVQSSPFGGIMVSEEIRVEVHSAGEVAQAEIQDTDKTSRRPQTLIGRRNRVQLTSFHLLILRHRDDGDMASMPRSGAGLLRRIAPVAGVLTAGGAIIYYTYRPRNIPGFEAAAVPPPIYGADGTFKLPRFPKVKSRDEQIRELKRTALPDGEYDILIVGGGATGTGVALDAATRGLKVALVERDDFSSGTSSKSTKLVHGGVRYLEKAFWQLDYSQLQLVMEALKERKYFLQTAPHLSMWLPIMLPIDRWWKAPYYWAGTKAYDFLAGSEGIESSYFLTRSKALEAFPMLKRTDLVGALVYYDGAHNDSRMNVSIGMTAALYGATVVNHMEVLSLQKDASGRLCGATVRDLVASKNGQKTQDVPVKAKCVINCTGPFTDSIRMMDQPDCKAIVSPASGVHIILPGYYSPSNMGLIDPSTSDGRVIFFLPWQGNTIAGTTDEPSSISQNPLPDEKSIEWVLKEISHYLSPDIKVRRGDVLAAWSGIRPLVKDPKAKNTESLVRNHLVDISASGLLTCAGGKWTTYRQMAEECVDAAIAEFNLQPKPLRDPPRMSGTDIIDDGAILDGSCKSHQVCLIGAHGFSKTLFINIIQHFGIETEVAKHLTESYGDRAWTVASLCRPTNNRFPARGERISQLYPFVDGEVRYAARHEYAQTAVDVLARRMRLAFLNAQASLEALPRIIDIMSEELAWDRQRQELEWRETVAFLESMGLPKPMLSATRTQVEQGKIDFANSFEYKMYSRHDGTADE